MSKSGEESMPLDHINLPLHYKRLVASRVGSSFKEVATLQEQRLAQPLSGEVVIRVKFAGINGGCETFRARGEYAFTGNKGKTNFPLGAEAVGIVVAIGPDVSNLKVGQAVAATGAGYSQYATVKAATCFPIREATPEAVAVSLSGLTAAAALLHKGGITAGKTVLVTAAAGGTGHFAVQIAKLKGCQIIATCGSAEKVERLLAVGADRVINYKEENVGEVLSREYPQKIDIAYEGVGGSLRDAVLANLSPDGQVLAVGYISEYPHTRSDVSSSGGGSGAATSRGHSWDLPPADQLMWGAQTLHNGSQTIHGQVWPKEASQVISAKKWLFYQYYSGAVQAWVDPKPFVGLNAVVNATEWMLSGNSIGKVVVDLSQ